MDKVQKSQKELKYETLNKINDMTKKIDNAIDEKIRMVKIGILGHVEAESQKTLRRSIKMEISRKTHVQSEA